MNNRPDIKNVEITGRHIFRLGILPLLHIEFACTDNDRDITKDIFNEIKKFAVIMGKPDRWFDLHDLLRMTYNADKNTIEFMESSPIIQENGNRISALVLLPSLLLRDWKVLNREESESLTTYINNNYLVENYNIDISAQSPLNSP